MTRNPAKTELAVARCSAYSRMPVVTRIADPSTDGRSTGFGILFHALARSGVVGCPLYP
jgi:hypothetical protein